MTVTTVNFLIMYYDGAEQKQLQNEKSKLL